MSWKLPGQRNSVVFAGDHIKAGGQVVVNSATSFLPTSIFPNSPSESKSELVDCLSRCSVLDNIHFGERGYISSIVGRLNSYNHPQPRRITYAIQTDDPVINCVTEVLELYSLFSYGSAHHPVEDWRCRPMPTAIFDLGVYLWQKSYSHLSPLSQACPPTGCQLNIYHSILGGHITPHKDNGVLDDFGREMQMCIPLHLNSQIRGTSVMTYCHGASMDFCVRVPTSSKIVNGKSLKPQDPDMLVELKDGDLMLWHPNDDEQFYHSARFTPGNCKGESKVRVAYNFRWLKNRMMFHGENPKYASLKHAAIVSEEEPLWWSWLLDGHEGNNFKNS